MTKLRYPFGGASVKVACANCTGAAHECSTEPAKHLPILGRRHTHNDEQNPTGTALAGDKLGADYRLYAEGSGRIAPGGQYRRCVGSETDGGADAIALARGTCADKRRKQQSHYQHNHSRRIRWRIFNVHMDSRQTRTNIYGRHWRRPTHAHHQQVHSLLYVETYRLTPKGVAA